VRQRRINEIKGVIVFAAGLIILASLVSFHKEDLSFYTSNPNIPAKNLIRGFGAYLSGALLFLIGWSAYIIPALILWQGVRYFRQEELELRVPAFIGFFILLISVSSLFTMLSSSVEVIQFSYGGIAGFLLSKYVVTYFGKLGAYIIFLTLAALSFTLVTELLLSAAFASVLRRVKSVSGLVPIGDFFERLVKNLKKRKKAINISPAPLARKEEKRSASPEPVKPLVGEPKPVKPKIQIKTQDQPKEPASKIKAQDLKIGDYQLPSLDLLESPPPLAERQIKEDLNANARILEDTLADFGIAVKVTDIERGPVITRYELEPAPGVKVNRIVALSDDIALAMKAQSVRIVAPIPGKGRVGVEVPNTHSSLVYFKEIITSPEFQKSDSKLTLALGKDITGKAVFAALDEMPHLLIAGTTGSGKTVCVNCLILSMLYRAHPDEVKFLMVDPKMVELATFNGLPHLLCPVVTDVKKVSAALGWVVSEMEERYKLLAKESVRNITGYNEKIEEKLPYIVVIIDELADLMVVARDQVESAITRLAQLSRAVGIHLILATQRPSVDVITGVIKANFPARVSFKVASKVDSRTVLDMNGADKLLGRGDMLFIQPGESKPTRAQGSLIADKEIERVVDFIKKQGEPVYDEEILKEGRAGAAVNCEKDDMYEESVRVIMETGQASVSILQRRLRLGYTRAARIIDMMEQEGMVGPYEGSKPRRILIDREEWLKQEVIGKNE
jgi:S-DNA-T family DNA segregation ATPase FtsK/SpoIIIE